MQYNYSSANAAARGAANSDTQGLWFTEEALNHSQTLSEIPDAENQIDPRLILKNLRLSRFQEEEVADGVEDLMKAAVNSGCQGFVARRKDFENEAESHFRDAMRFALQARQQVIGGRPRSDHDQIVFAAVCFALNCGEVSEARRLIREASSAGVSIGSSKEWKLLRDVSLWKDAWLIAAIRRPHPDMEALNVLGERYWKSLASRCQALTTNRERAIDLAQDTWCRALRTRERLKPGGNFPGYLATIATNLWRDAYRLFCRSGELAENNIYSLDVIFTDIHGGQSTPLVERIPDPHNLSPAERIFLVLDLDKGLKNLKPQLRDVLQARFIQGESCAEIAKRCQCTEQTVSGWVRHALAKMRNYLETDI